MFFVDKYTPTNIDEALFHKSELAILKQMSMDDSIPHLIFYGPEGSGKKTLIKIFMEMLYDSDVHKLVDSTYVVTGSGNNTKDVIIKQSNYHIIIEPNNNNFDKYLIQDVVKEYARKKPLGVFACKKEFKIVLINNVGNLSWYAQTSLRRTMEKFSKTCRFIMWCRSLEKVIEPLRSRCYCFRVNSPSPDDIFILSLHVACKEKIQLSFKDHMKISNDADGDVKKTMWMLQLRKIGAPASISYDKAIDTIVKFLIACDINNVIKIRIIIYNIMITNITGSQIIKDITNQLLYSDKVNILCKLAIAEIAAKFEHNLIRGRREIIHIEAFITGIIATLI